MGFLEKLIPKEKIKTPYGNILFYCTSWIAVARAKTLLSKEFETIKWINNFPKDSSFWDIGANIGTFSLYAGKKGISKVLSFEPLYSNYMALMKNIEINNLSHNISGYSFAFNEVSSLDYFFIRDTKTGRSGNSFGQNKDQYGNIMQTTHKQVMIGFSIDQFIEWFQPPFPNFIKIDVDGIEPKILKGAQKTLRDKRLQSILVEFYEEGNETQDAIDLLERHGFKIINKSITTENNEDQMYNYIFSRS